MHNGSLPFEVEANTSNHLAWMNAILGPHVPRDVGLWMIAAGVGSLALFTWQYLRAVGYLGREPFAAISLQSRAPLHQLTCLTAYAILLLGALAFASVFLSF